MAVGRGPASRAAASAASPAAAYSALRAAGPPVTQAPGPPLAPPSLASLPRVTCLLSSQASSRAAMVASGRGTQAYCVPKWGSVLVAAATTAGSLEQMHTLAALGLQAARAAWTRDGVSAWLLLVAAKPPQAGAHAGSGCGRGDAGCGAASASASPPPPPTRPHPGPPTLPLTAELKLPWAPVGLALALAPLLLLMLALSVPQHLLYAARPCTLSLLLSLYT